MVRNKSESWKEVEAYLQNNWNIMQKKGKESKKKEIVIEEGTVDEQR